MGTTHVIPNADQLQDPGKAGALVEGRLQILPYAFWQDFTQTEISYFCVQHGFYCIPTKELVEFLGNLISGRIAIEIGSGNGVLAQVLGIKATDSFQQRNPEIAALYAAQGQAVVPYGKNVERWDALDAVRRYKPNVVIGAWVTHKYNIKEHWREGNAWGVDEKKILNYSDYISIGHTYVHRGKPIWELPYQIYYPDYLVSRALSEGKNYVAVWRRES